MEVQIISSTAQKFNGETYYLCGNYFQRKGKRLHREVWTYHNGDIPKGYHVHHIDHNRSNNSIDNLNLIKGTEHLHQHMEEPERKAQSRKSIDIARKELRLSCTGSLTLFRITFHRMTLLREQERVALKLLT